MPPAVTMISFLRPVMRRKPSSSSSPRSPVWNQPSASIASAVAASLFQYRVKTWSPRMRISPSSAMRTVTPGRGRPTVPMRMACSLLDALAGEVSVRPYPS